MLRYLGPAVVFITLGLWARAAVQGQDDKKEPEIILKKKDRKDDPKKAVDDPNKDPKNEKDKDKPKRELPKIDTLPDEPEGTDEDPAKIVERIKKNLSTTDERLDKKDPGDETRKLQDKIVKDLDELIKQKQDQDDKNQQNSNSSQSSSSKSSKSSSQQKSSSSKKSSSSQKSASGNKEDKQPKGANGEKPEPMGSGKELKDPKGGQSAKGQDPKKQDGKSNGNGGKGGDSNAKNKSTVADLYPDIWGHLPQTKRLEMDAYSRERFMPRYEELLRQYYRTIAEQTRRKEGD